MTACGAGKFASEYSGSEVFGRPIVRIFRHRVFAVALAVAALAARASAARSGPQTDNRIAIPWRMTIREVLLLFAEFRLGRSAPEQDGEGFGSGRDAVLISGAVDVSCHRSTKGRHHEYA